MDGATAERALIFKRRETPPFLDRAREFVYPRRGWRRATSYLGHRIRRIPDTPHRIALGFAIGAFVSFSPLFGVHLLYAVALAWVLRANVLASLIGTLVGNPLTFPIIAPLALSLGRLMLGHRAQGGDFGAISHAFAQAGEGIRDGVLSLFGRAAPDWGKLAAFFDELLLPYFIGGLPPGLAVGILCYGILRPLVAAYQAARRARLTERARLRAAELAQAHRAGTRPSDSGAAAPVPYAPPSATQGETP